MLWLKCIFFKKFSNKKVQKRFPSNGQRIITTHIINKPSTHQHINTWTDQQHNTSHQHNTSTHQHINKTHQHINTSTHQHINTSTHQHINTSTHQHINTLNTLNTSTRQHINNNTIINTIIFRFKISFSIKLLLTEVFSLFFCMKKKMKSGYWWGSQLMLDKAISAKIALADIGGGSQKFHYPQDIFCVASINEPQSLLGTGH